MRKLLIGMGVGLVLLIVAVSVAVWRLDPNDIVRLVESEVQALTGRDFKIEGKIGLSISPLPTVVAEGIRLQNAPWGSRPDMLKAKRVEIQVALLPLLKGDVEIRGLTVVEPDVLLEVGPHAQRNWEFLSEAEQPAAPGSPGPRHILIREVHIERGVIAYRDAQIRRDESIRIETLALTTSSDSVAAKGAVAIRDVPVEIDAKVDHGGRLGTTDAKGNASIVLIAPGVRLSGKGVVPVSAGGPAGLDFRFNAAISDWSTWAKLSALHARELPGLKAEGVVRAEGEAIAIEDLKASLGKSSAAGSIRVKLGPNAHGVDARLDAPLVDLVELLGPKAAEPSPDGRIFAADPLPLQGLKGLNGRFDLTIAKLALRDGKTLDGLHTRVRMDNGRVIADPTRIRVEGKELHLKLYANASSGESVALNLALDAQGVSLGALAAMLDIAGAPEGSPTDLSVRLSGAANSMRTLMASANGDVRVVVGPGRIKNRAIDLGADVTELLNAINPAHASEPYTEIKCVAVRLPISQGVARIDNSIGVETEKVNVMVAGVIDLRNETLDLGFRPQATTGLGVGFGGLAGLGRLRGAIGDPKVELDTAGAATAAAQLGLATATGGLSLFAQALLSQEFPKRPCQAALTAVATASTTAGEPQRQPGVVDGAVDGIKRFLGR